MITAGNSVGGTQSLLSPPEYRHRPKAPCRSNSSSEVSTQQPEPRPLWEFPKIRGAFFFFVFFFLGGGGRPYNQDPTFLGY